MNPMDQSIDVPVACALDKKEFLERQALWGRLAQSATGRRRIPNGLALGFERECGLVGELADCVELEQRCCPFLSFRIDARAGADIWLEVTGSAAAQEIINELLAPLPPS